MATTKKTKVGLEVLLVRAELKGIPEKALLKSRNMVQVDMVWPRPSIARKSAMREAAFRHGACDFTDEPWTKRIVLREDVEGHCGFAVSVTEPVSIQKLRQFLRLTAKYALKMGADFREKAMVGEKNAPKIIAQGVLDLEHVPDEGEELEISVPLARPLTKKSIGSLTLLVRA